MNKIQDVVELYRFVSNIFGYKAQMLYADSGKKKLAAFFMIHFCLNVALVTNMVSLVLELS